MSIRISAMWGVVVLLAVAVSGLHAARDDEERAGRRERVEKEPESRWWRSYDDVQLAEGGVLAGDLVRLKVNLGTREETWLIRLYGVDCPETLAGDADAQRAQVKFTKMDPGLLAKWGEQAKRHTEAKLSEAKGLRLHVKRTAKEKVPAQSGGEQAYFGIIEYKHKEGKMEQLHSSLLWSGLVLPGGRAAPWPIEKEIKEGNKVAEEQFEKDIAKCINDSRKDKKGLWAGEFGLKDCEKGEKGEKHAE